MVVPPTGDAAGEHFLAVRKNQIRGARADVDEQRAAGGVAVIIAEGVVKRHRGHVHDVRLEAEDSTHCLRSSSRSDLMATSTTSILFSPSVLDDELVVPDHLVDRKWDVLLRFKVMIWSTLLRVHGRELDETGEHRLRGDRVVHLVGLDLEVPPHFLDGDFHLRRARGNRPPGRPPVREAVGLKHKTAGGPVRNSARPTVWRPRLRLKMRLGAAWGRKCGREMSQGVCVSDR